MPRFPDIVTNQVGTALPGAFVTVRNSPAGTLASITADNGTALPNPLTADGNGAYYFNAPVGIYSLEFRLISFEPPRKIRVVDLDTDTTALAVGLFVNSATFNIPLGVVLVQSSGYSAADKGSAIYVFDAAVNSAYVAANPLISFLSTIGLGFRLSTEQEIWPDMLGALGGGADDTAALTAFFNHAIANPGVKHSLPAAPFSVSAPMPAINVSNAWIEGQGAHIHDGGTPQMSGTVIKYIGAAALTSSVVQITSVSGAGNQRVANVKFKGIGIDCNTGAIGYGLSVMSVRECDIDVVVLNAGTRGANVGVVAALVEDKNVQRCKFRLNLRQTEVAVPCYYLDGDATSNVSMNELWVDAVHKNAVAGVHANSDNNLFRYFRAFRAVGGTATESVSLFGGANSAQRARGEVFEFFSSTVAAKAYGTDAYTVASGGNFMSLDTENATPIPVLGTGAVVNYEQNTTPTAELAWATYTPTLVSATGTITTVGAVSGSSRKIGKRVEFKAQVAITTNGTGATSLSIGLPVAAAGTVGSIINGRETALTGKALTGFISTGGSIVSVLFYDGTYPGADGRSFNISGFYEVA